MNPRLVRAAACCVASLIATASGAATQAKPHATPRSSITRSLKAPALARPATPPSFEGTWVLDTTRSRFGDLPGGRPRARTDVIHVRGNQIEQSLFIEITAKPDTTVYHYTADSTDCENQAGGQKIHSRMWREGGALRIDSKMRLMGVIESSLKERWSLSPDGATLTLWRALKSIAGTGEQTLVFARKPEGSKP